MYQLDLHKKIDDLLKLNPATISVDSVDTLINTNTDARRYFFDQVDENWLNWLWENKFLDVIKEKSKDLTRLSYQTTELDYLVKIAVKKPKEVVDIILAVPFSKDHFNLEVIDRFSWICGILPPNELARVVPKMRDEEWIKLMGPFNRGFEYEKMFENLLKAKEYGAVITLAEAVLFIRTEEEFRSSGKGVTTDNPFYTNNLGQTNVFTTLVSVSEEYYERALSVLTNTLGKVIKLGNPKDNDVFSIGEMFHLFDVDFFDLKLEENKYYSYRDDVRNLAAAVKIMCEKTIGKESINLDEAKRLFNEYITPLPDSRSIWRLKLFIWSLHPEIFKEELKNAFFRAFESENHPWQIAGGAEYEHTLKKGFSRLSDEDQRSYINKCIEFFGKNERFQAFGIDILSSVPGNLITSEEKIKIKKVFKNDLNPGHVPEPSIKSQFAGAVIPQVPPGSEEEWKKPIPEIAEFFRTKWTPESLQSLDTKKDFLHPINAEGISGKMRSEIPKRFQEYIENASLFFEREKLDSHYTYSFLRGVEDVIKEKKTELSKTNWDGLFELFKNIVISGNNSPFDPTYKGRESFDAWLAGWSSVHSAMADALNELTSGSEESSILDFNKYRNQTLEIIKYLLTHPDPTPEEDTKSDNDPFSRAINTARGRAFETFVSFVYRDSANFKEDKIKISKDVKEIYENTLDNEETTAIRFLFGHYIPTFFFRDRDWFKNTISSKIFSEGKKDIFLAAWEGYLTANLYEDLFILLNDLYEKAIDLDESEYTKRKYFKDLDTVLATHIALAFTHFENKSDLFDKFWEKENIKRQKEFISFVGRTCVSRDNADLVIKAEKIQIDRLKEFWDWAIENVKNKEILSEFGFWMNLKSKAFSDEKWVAQNTRKTLEKTGGEIDWNYGLMESLPEFLKVDPEETLKILDLHLKNLNTKEGGGWIRVDEDLLGIFKDLYRNPVTKEGAYNLINELLILGSQRFWILKNALE